MSCFLVASYFFVPGTSTSGESPGRSCLLIAQVHKCTVPSVGAKVRVGNGRLALFAGEPVEQFRVRFEFGRTTVELPRVTKHHPAAPMHWPHSAAQVHVGIAELAQ